MKCESAKRINYDQAWRIQQQKTKGTAGVYGLADPRDPERIRYVGSSDCIEHRLYAHTHSRSARGDKHARGQWLRALHELGVKPFAWLLEPGAFGPTGSARRHQAESWWIEELAATGQADLNTRLTPVGHPTSSDSPGKVRARDLDKENAALRAEVASLRAELAALRQVGDLV